MERVSSHVFRLGLSLALSRIHPVFHVSLLQPTSSSDIPDRVVDPPPPIELDDSDEWEVNRILDSKVDWHRKGPGLLYLVKWKGFDNTPDATSWEPPKHLAHVPDLVQDFHRASGTSRRSKSLWLGNKYFLTYQDHTLMPVMHSEHFLKNFFTLHYR